MNSLDQVFNIVEATIDDHRRALSSGLLTSEELVTKYLLRIATYDIGGPALNAFTTINPKALDEARASDERRAAGHTVRPLEGIPYTLKDSFKYEGLTVACGAPAFEGLMSSEDSFLASRLRAAGAVLLGKTNMPPMAAGGMQRGLYGRALSPYNAEYLTAAFASGSSNGAASSTAASFAAFGLGSETVSSGRSPASNNGLVCYTPSRGILSCRGIWPLYGTCDVPVPYTRNIKDMLEVLEVLSASDPNIKGDFWREQPHVKLPETTIPQYDTLANANSLRGKRIGVPKMFIGEHDPAAKAVTTDPAIIALWQTAKADLESQGATIISTDFPVVTNYENDSISQQPNNVVGAPSNWNAMERGTIIAKSWDDFLIQNGDPNFPNLGSVDKEAIFPKPPGYIPDLYMEAKNAISYPGLVDIAKKHDATSIYDLPGMSAALPALEAQRKRDLEDWMDAQELDLIVFPANGDVGRADLEHNTKSAEHAIRNGVRYSNGNRAIRHLGVPTVSVTMGIMADKKMPVNLTFAGKAYSDEHLLSYAYAFEQSRSRRLSPPLTPGLDSDIASWSTTGESPEKGVTSVTIEAASRKMNAAGSWVVRISGKLTLSHSVSSSAFTVHVGGKPAQKVLVDGKDAASTVASLRGTAAWEAEAEHGHSEYAKLTDYEKPLMDSSSLVLATVKSGAAFGTCLAMA